MDAGDVFGFYSHRKATLILFGLRKKLQKTTEKQKSPFTQMAAIGSLVFCTACGNLLDGSSGDKKATLTCEICGIENQGIIHRTEA